MAVSMIAYFAKKKKNNNNNRTPSTIQEICSHKQLQCDLWGDGKFWNLGTAVGVSYFVHEISTDFGQHMGRNFSEVNLIGFVLRKLAWTT